MPAAFSGTTRALAQHTAGAAVAAWSLAAVCLAAWLTWFWLGRVTVYEISHQARLEMQQATQPVAALLGGRVTRSALTLGAQVRQGDVLVELDAASEWLRLRQAQARLQALVAQEAALQRELAAHTQAGEQGLRAAQAAQQGAQLRTQAAAAAATYADEQARRLGEESRSGGVARVEALQAQAEAQQLAAARDAVAAEAHRLDADAAVRAAQQRGAADGLQRTQSALQGERDSSAAVIAGLQLDIERHRLRAPVAGRIADMAPLRVGDVVPAGQKFATLVPAGELIVVADFEPAAVLGRVHAGQTARLRLDGYPWAQYGSVAATVSRVASEIRDQRIRVELTPHAPWPAGVVLQHGLPGAVEIIVDEVSPALLLLRASGQLMSGGPAAAQAR